MENIQSAINSALEGKPHEFKGHIEDILADKVANFLTVKKMELAGSIFNNEEQQQEDQQQEFQFSSEGNVDEDL
jgi:hypothetical protein